ncbi:neuraminidase-like domain-containing protein [Mesorhizobium sp. M0933]|uniref:Tc toxin subunit A-related protein n=1 Tax=Mesorhizobium sp. M0933 TaxID=2957030 RepID=UPI00333BE3FF
MSDQDKLDDVISLNRPDYSSLFGSAEFCDCPQCRSVHSPAAYLVDLLQFLGPDIPGITPLDVLIGNAKKTWADGTPIVGRRPDLAYIQLSCENTNTTMPYVDLVNEVLESYIAFKQSLPLKTEAGGNVAVPAVPAPNESSAGVTAAELGANPENIRDTAYDRLEGAVYPFTLPFHQPLTSLRLNLKQMDSSLHEVMSVFRKDNSAAFDTALDVEALSMTEHEYAILTGTRFDGTAPVPPLPPVSEFYGFSAPPAPADIAWVSGGLPAGAVQQVLGDAWAFAPFAPPPPSGANMHASALNPGLHQHFFDSVADPNRLKVAADDFLYAEIFLDPANPPQMLMLQFFDGSWSHRAYWGESKFDWGVEATASRRYMGPMPAAGAWVKLEVPARYVGLRGTNLTGMAFTLFGGSATWGAAGTRSPSWAEQVTQVPTLLARTGITYLDLIAFIATRHFNPSLPQGAALEAFERIPIGFGTLAQLVTSNFANPDPQTLTALAAAGMTIAELQAWAAEQFATISKMMVLDAPDSTCDLSLTRLLHLDGTLLDEAELERLHRFIRLWRKTGWSIVDLDRAMTALQASDITAKFLRQLGQITQLQSDLELPAQKLLSFWGNIPVDGDDALYNSLFLNRAVRSVDPEFQPVEGGYLTAAGLKLVDHMPALLAGLRTRAADLMLIRQHARWTSAPGAPPTMTPFADDNTPLTLATATVLYRYATLARALHMAVKDVIRLEILSGKSPFSRLSQSNKDFDEADIDPARTLGFVRLAISLAKTAFRPATLDYLFGGTADTFPSLAPAGETIGQQLAIIRDGLVRIANDNVASDDPNGELTRTKLAQIFEPHIVEQLAGLIAGTAAYSVPLAALPAGVVLPAGSVSYNGRSRLLTSLGWLTDAAKAALLGLSGVNDYRMAVQSLYDQPRSLLTQTLVARLEWPAAAKDLQAAVLEAPTLNADGSIDTTRVAAKFKAFLAAMLPTFRVALSRALVKQTLASALGLDPSAIALLLEGDDCVLPLGTDADKTVPAISDFLALSGDGLTGEYFADNTLTAPAVRTVMDAAISFSWDPRAALGARWTGKLVPEKTQTYQFHVRAAGGVRLMLDGALLIDRWNDGPPTEYTVASDLNAGQPYDLKLEYFNLASVDPNEVPALLELRWSSASTPAEVIPTRQLYSATRGDVEAFARHTYIRLHKASLLIGGFGFSVPEIARLTDPVRAGSMNLNLLPVDALRADPAQVFAAWSRLNDFITLRGLAVADPQSLSDVFDAPNAAPALEKLQQATGFEATALASLAGAAGLDLQDADYRDVAKLLALANAVRLLGSLAAPVTQLFSWAVAAPDMKQARTAAQEAKRAYKARYDDQSWVEAAHMVADPLREAQRAALVAYLLPRLGYTETGQLFEHFLIDVEMSACMQTSRIKQAISSVQLFIQRCRLNLEMPHVSPRMIDGDRWAWMQNYRVWEANLKIFLFPENWIEAELRDDKSPFFKELESDLLQAELTADAAEIALGSYLEKLDTVSQLEICGLYEQRDFLADEKRQSVLHVFGRSFATPRIFYYRQFVTVNPTYTYWTAWEKVPLDIQADEVSPVIWNRRLYLFWTVTIEKADLQTSNKYTTYGLAWSEYRQKKWTAKQVTPASIAVAIANPGVRLNIERVGDKLNFVFALPAGGIGPGSLPTGGGPQYAAISKWLGTITLQTYNGIASSSDKISNKTYHSGFLAAGAGDMEFLPVADPGAAIPVFARTPGIISFYSPGSKPYTLNDYFFMQEGPRTYLVLPSSSAPGDISPFLAGGITPYLVGDNAANAFSYDKASVTHLEPQFKLLSVKANPWQSGQAGIAAAEAQFLTSTATTSAPISASALSVGSQIFHHGAIKPSDVFAAKYPADFTFETFFHPYSAEYQRRLNRYGVAGLLTIGSQRPADLPKIISFADAYDPAWSTVNTPWPQHIVDFSFSGAYSLYNWELFFHLPLLIATRLSQNQRFEEAMSWFHYIFNPTVGDSPDPVPQRYWNVLPLRENQPQRLDDLLKALNAGDKDAIGQWEDLQAHPFQPHRVARLRLVAYQKTVVMKYIDNLIAWGDQLFRQDTIETINQATQLYVLAAILLGPRAQRVPAPGKGEAKTYATLRSAQLDPFNQTLVEFENDLPFSNRATTSAGTAQSRALLGIGRSFYFCLPQNDKLQTYWDTVANRLFNIRHCMNIEGVVRELPLFEPPIDPALLVRAAAQGIDIGSVLSDLSAPLPYYRFNVLLAKALEMAAELRTLGSALLAALEKRDAEHLSNLRTAHEAELLSLTKQLKQQQLAEAQASETALQKTRDVTQTRFDFYDQLRQRISEETNQLNELAQAQANQEDAQSEERTTADIASYSTDISLGASFGTPPSTSISAAFGRGNVLPAHEAKSREKGYKASLHTYHANLSSILGGWQRRSDDWKLQKDLAAKELVQIDKQIVSAGIRVACAQQDLDNTTRQIEQCQEVQEFLRNKFTGEELYSWMAGDISTVFFQCYQMAYDLAKKAERCHRFELGLTSSNFVQFGAWDSMRKGLMSGERLYLQLKQLERAYFEGNRRDYELTKHFSLVMNAPLELIKLKELGWCEVDLPEAVFDVDFPGHYMRRIKSVGISIPAVVGPYTGINCTLTLLRDKTRIKNTPADGYAERDGEEDDRFLTSWTRMQSIAASNAQNDSGLFELNFRDERYLPFEGAGAISRWRIELPRTFRQFNYDTISDVVLHIRYTARSGGAPLREAAVASLKQQLKDEEGMPQTRAFSLKHEFPSEWHRLRTVADVTGDHSQSFSLHKQRFPFPFQGGAITVDSVEILGVPNDRFPDAAPPDMKITLAGPLGTPDLPAMGNAVNIGLLVHRVVSDAAIEVKNLGKTGKEADWTIRVVKGDIANVLDRLKDIILLCHYTVAMPKDE